MKILQSRSLLLAVLLSVLVSIGVPCVPRLRKYLVMKKDGSLAGCIARLYEMGYHTNWTAPSVSMSLTCVSSTSAAQAVVISSEDTAARDSRRNSNGGSPPNLPPLQHLLFPRP